MQLSIKKRYFYSLEGINSINAHIDKLTNVIKKDNIISGTIEINLSYLDVDNMECFKVIPYDFELQLSELNVIDVNLGNVRILVVENNGLDIECDLVVNYIIEKGDVLQEVIEIEPITEVEIDNKEEMNKIKEDISEYYEEKLAETLKTREETPISKVVHETKKDFLSFIKNESKHYVMKSVHVENDEQLDKISKEYKVPIEKLLKNYDRENKIVKFKFVK